MTVHRSSKTGTDVTLESSDVEIKFGEEQDAEIEMTARTSDSAIKELAIAGQDAFVQVAASSNPDGGDVVIEGGNANTSDTTAGTGGDILLKPGAAGQLGPGSVQFFDDKVAGNNLASVSEGLTSGDFGLFTQDQTTDMTFGFLDSGTWRPVLNLDQVASQENYFEMLAGADGVAPILKAEGLDDTNIDIALEPKGTGKLTLAGSETFTTAAAGTMTIQDSAFSAADNALDLCTGAVTNSSGDYVGVELKPIINQSGSAGFTLFKINYTATASGSGQQFFQTWGSDNNENVSIDTQGAITQSAQRGSMSKFVTDLQTNTTDAIPSVISSVYQSENDSCAHITATVIAVKSDGSEVASYRLHGTFKNDGGTLTQVGSTTSAHTVESDVNWDAVFTVNTPNLDITVTGAAETISWSVCVESYVVVYSA